MRVLQLLCIFLTLITFITSQNVPDTIKEAVKNLKSTIPSLKNDISRASHSLALQNLLNIGYQKISETGSVVSFNAVPNDKLDGFIDYSAKAFKVTEDLIQDYKGTLKEIEMMDFKGCVAEKFFFTELEGGKVRYLWVLGERIEEKNITNWLIVNFEATFTLAPHVYYQSESHCSWFGLSCDTTTKRIEVPTSLTKEEIYLLGKFYEISTLDLLN